MRTRESNDSFGASEVVLKNIGKNTKAHPTTTKPEPYTYFFTENRELLRSQPSGHDRVAIKIIFRFRVRLYCIGVYTLMLKNIFIDNRVKQMCKIIHASPMMHDHRFESEKWIKT